MTQQSNLRAFLSSGSRPNGKKIRWRLKQNIWIWDVSSVFPPSVSHYFSLHLRLTELFLPTVQRSFEGEAKKGATFRYSCKIHSCFLMFPQISKSIHQGWWRNATKPCKIWPSCCEAEASCWRWPTEPVSKKVKWQRTYRFNRVLGMMSVVGRWLQARQQISLAVCIGSSEVQLEKTV